jgi:hypothetical protein
MWRIQQVEGKMKQHELKAILADVHRAIEESAPSVVDSIGVTEECSISYSPGEELSEIELDSISRLQLDPVARNALRKLIRDACCHPVFHLFSLLDGVADPTVIKLEEWYGGELGSNPEGDREMLHDALYESYWDCHD